MPSPTAATTAAPIAASLSDSNPSAAAWTSMPATISGLRPIVSDQWPVAIWATLHTAG